MSLTLGLTGMDPATEASLMEAFAAANARLGGRCQLVSEGEAGYVVVDMDSMYGPMSWLRLHAAGKSVVGLTSAPRAQTDFRLPRPFDAHAMTRLLREIADKAGVAMPPPGEDEQRASALATAPQAPAMATPSGGPASTPQGRAGPASAGDDAPAARSFAGWLAADGLRGRVRYQREAGPTLLIDADAGIYHGPSTLKPVAQYFDGVVEASQFQSLDGAAWERESADLGAPQPLSRLVWLGGLLSGRGQLQVDASADTLFRLGRWPQTEREYPRHLRIATVLMKAPATLDEIAGASGVPLNEVVDFLNANLATGFAEVASTPGDAPEPPKPGGLLDRLRRR